MTTRREALAAAARARAVQRPGTPGRLHATAVGETSVTLAWRRAHDHRRHVHYEVLRDGRRVGVAHHSHFTDVRLRPATLYHYRVRAVDDARRKSRASRRLTVRTRAAALPAGSPGSPPAPPPPGLLSGTMVDRLFWRAGFGASPADRAQWTGQPVAGLVEHFLTAPGTLAAAARPTTYNGNPPDPLASDTELVLEWLDRMVRTTNPFVERMTFFWHRHWAVSRSGGSPAQAMVAYRDRLRRYAEFAANPSASFRDLAREMTKQDAAMLYWLTGYLNRTGRPNENYGREFMELFCLGVTDLSGNPNYSQSDVHGLARAFTGYTLDNTHTVAGFNPARADTGPKTIFGQTAAFDANSAIDLVLSHPSHAPFLVNKLWREFIAAPLPADALADLAATYTAGGSLALVPLLRKILSHPLIFASLEEPGLVKPPVVHTVGVLRTLGAPLRDRWQTDSLSNMQQQPYFPPNVAGWEGGLSWLNSNTATARLDLVVRCLSLLPAVADLPAETPQQALDRAYASCGAPWLGDASRALLLSYAQQAPTASAAQRRQRQYTLMAFMLGGPDAQVM